MDKQVQALAVMTILLGIVLVQIEGNSIPNGTTLSPWLKKFVKPRPSGCRERPWICSRGGFPPRSLCCRNRCVDVVSDRYNCGLCGVRCPFNWQCCRGLCSDTNRSKFNCGGCGNRCPRGVSCFFGMCGYGHGPSPKQKQKQKPPPDFHQPPATAKEEF